MECRRMCRARIVAIALCSSLALGVIGCYEIHEEVWIRDDGTVRYALDYAVPEFMIVSASQIDGGNADSVLAQMRRPPVSIVDGDSVFNRDYLERDLRHFVSERRISSVKRWMTLAARSEAHEDSIARQAATRDSISKALTQGKTGKRYMEVMDSLRQAEPPQSPDNPNPFAELTGYVLGGYQLITDGSGATRIRHTVFPMQMKTKLVDMPQEGDERPTGRLYSGRSYSYRLHAPHIMTAEGATRTGDQAEWSFPMADLIDTVHTLDVVIPSPRR